MKTNVPVDESTYCAFLQAMYKYSRLHNSTHHRSTYARRLKLVQNHIYHKTGRSHPVRRLITQVYALKSKDSHAKPVMSKLVNSSGNSQLEHELSLNHAQPTVARSADPVDYNHTILPASPGISRRRPKLVIPTLQNQLPPIPTFDRPPSSADSLPKSQPHFFLLSPPPQTEVSPSLPYTPLEQITHTPLLPPEIPRFTRVKTNLRVTLANQCSSEYNTPILSPRASQDPASPLFHPLDTLRSRNASANPRPLLRPRQLSYFHSVSAGPASTPSPKVGGALDTSSGTLRTESLASPLILFQPTWPPSLGPTL